MLGRDWLHVYLPHCLQKINRVSFGILSDTDKAFQIDHNSKQATPRESLAVPFIGKDVPSSSSEFAQPDVILGLTILSYKYQVYSTM